METISEARARGMQRQGRQLQAPLVDSASCGCRVEAGLRTMVGAGKFVPGAKLCLQSEIKPPGPKSKTSRRDRRPPSPLLPGLPDDLAVVCMARVPRADHRNLRLVCRRWYRLLAGNFFFSLRKRLGFAEEWLYVIKRDKDGKISWTAFDPTYQLWLPLPPLPAEYSDAVGFGTNRWHRAPDMLRRRHCFGACSVGDRLFVAGGHCEGLQRSLRSAEVFDPVKNRWGAVADMAVSMVPLIGVTHGGNWFIKGLSFHRQVVSGVFSPAANQWLEASEGMVAGWRNPSVSFNGQLYAVDCKDGCKLRCYVEESDSWVRFADSKAHLGSSRALEAAALVQLKGKLCIVRNNMSITMVDMDRAGRNLATEDSDRIWETVAGKGQLRTFVTNLLSSIAGRSTSRSHIVHCQVLQA
ncbi:galactose oxidase/kelch repeat superfamily protein isoform X2 [Wolffia australiana]